MSNLKKFIINSWSDFDEVSTMIKDDEFNGFIGTSKSDYHSILKKVNQDIDYSSFNKSKTDSKKRIGFEALTEPNIGYLAYADNNAYLNFYLENCKHKTIDSSVFCASELNYHRIQPTDTLKLLYPNTLSLQSHKYYNAQEVNSSVVNEILYPAEIHLLEYDELDPDYDLKVTLKKKFQNRWREIYNKLIELRRIFKILAVIFIKRKESITDQFYNSTSRTWKNEYFDLVFTVK